MGNNFSRDPQILIAFFSIKSKIMFDTIKFESCLIENLDLLNEKNEVWFTAILL